MKAAVVYPESSLMHALEALNVSTLKLLVVVDAITGEFIRTLTDGDIRRSLLNGCGLNSRVSDLSGREAVTAEENTSGTKLREKMDSEGVDVVVLLDEKRRPTRTVQRGDLPPSILLSSPDLGTNELVYVKQAFSENWIAPAGRHLDLFEDRIAEMSGRTHAIAVSSGTAGIHLALDCLDLPSGASVYVSDKTFVASAQPVLYSRLTPVFIDSEPHSWNMCPRALKSKLEVDREAGVELGAIILVHLYGQPALVREILEVANEFDVPVIEDAAESLGASYEGRPSGSHGAIGVYSFNGNKIITTSAGGAVICDDEDLAQKIRYLSTQGRERVNHYQHHRMAYNYRMSNLLAAVGLGQLEVLHDRVERRREIHEIYREILGQIEGLSFQEEVGPSRGNRWLTALRIDPDSLNAHPFTLIRHLKRAGIEARPSWKPMHMQPLFADSFFQPRESGNIVSSSLFLTALCLPSGSSLSNEDVKVVARNVESFIKEWGTN